MLQGFYSTLDLSRFLEERSALLREAYIVHYTRPMCIFGFKLACFLRTSYNWENLSGHILYMGYWWTGSPSLCLTFSLHACLLHQPAGLSTSLPFITSTPLSLCSLSSSACIPLYFSLPFLYFLTPVLSFSSAGQYPASTLPPGPRLCSTFYCHFLFPDSFFESVNWLNYRSSLKITFQHVF